MHFQRPVIFDESHFAEFVVARVGAIVGWLISDFVDMAFETAGEELRCLVVIGITWTSAPGKGDWAVAPSLPNDCSIAPNFPS